MIETIVALLIKKKIVNKRVELMIRCQGALIWLSKCLSGNN